MNEDETTLIPWQLGGLLLLHSENRVKTVEVVTS